MPVPPTLVLALTSVAARTRRTHPIAPNPTVLLCEHIWWLENEVEYILKHDWHPDHDEVLHEPDKYMLENIEFFAMRLWKGEQVDGTVLQSWARIYKEENITPAVGGTIRADRITKFPSAVMAGYRYITSFKSTPRCMRPLMHDDLFSRSCEFRCLNALK